MKLSVIIAAGYARPFRLMALCDKLMHQSQPPDEVIIADDTGGAGDWSIVVQQQWPFALLVVPSEMPADVNGVSVARNKAAQATDSDLLLFLDDDSLPHRMCCEVHRYVHEQHSEVPLAILGQRSGEYEYLKARLPLQPYSDKAKREVQGVNWGNFISNNLSVNHQAFDAVGGFDEDFAQADEYGWEDIELGIRWMSAGYQFGYTPDALVYHPDVPRTPEKQARAGKAHLRLVAKHPGLFVRTK